MKGEEFKIVACLHSRGTRPPVMKGCLQERTFFFYIFVCISPGGSGYIHVASISGIGHPICRPGTLLCLLV